MSPSAGNPISSQTLSSSWFPSITTPTTYTSVSLAFLIDSPFLFFSWVTLGIEVSSIPEIASSTSDSSSSTCSTSILVFVPSTLAVSSSDSDSLVASSTSSSSVLATSSSTSAASIPSFPLLLLL